MRRFPLSLAALLLPAAALARPQEGAPAPSFPEIVAEARALSAGPGADGAPLSAYAARLRGGRVSGWPAWVVRTYKEHDQSTYAAVLVPEDPYAAAPEGKVAPSPARRPAAPRTAQLYLEGLGTPEGLQPGGKLYVDGIIKDAVLDREITLRLEHARFTAAPAPAVPEGARGDLKDLVVSLERGACLGRCPMYKITAAGSVTGAGGGGVITWSGRNFVGVRGEQKGPIDAARLRQVAAAFARADFLRLQGSYERRMVTDQPSVVVTFRHGKEQKTVRHYLGDRSAPVKLLILESQLDALLGSSGWIEAAQ